MVAVRSMSKYRRWYDQLINRARDRQLPRCYTEMHHIVPVSLGGTDSEINLVRLTYREHFLAHWLLTKFKVGGELRKMQRALFAMTLSRRHDRPLVSSWQYEAARRAVRDLELDPNREAEWMERWRAARRSTEEERRKREAKARENARLAATRTIEQFEGQSPVQWNDLSRLASALITANMADPVEPLAPSNPCQLQPLLATATRRKLRKGKPRHRKSRHLRPAS